MPTAVLPALIHALHTQFDNLIISRNDLLTHLIYVPEEISGATNVPIGDERHRFALGSRGEVCLDIRADVIDESAIWWIPWLPTSSEAPRGAVWLMLLTSFQWVQTSFFGMSSVATAGPSSKISAE